MPVWGHAIKKIECVNHVCKCYQGALEQLVKNNTSYKGSGGLTVKMRKRLVSAARCAIRMRSKESDTAKALVSLRKDLINGPLHCFGIHTRCSPDFCSTAKENQKDKNCISTNSFDDVEKDSTQEENDDIEGICIIAVMHF